MKSNDFVRAPSIKDLAEVMAIVAGIDAAQARKALSGLVQMIQDQTADGLPVRIPGLGTFSAKERPARTGRNPQTGEPIAIAASRKLVFKAAKTAKSKE